MKNKKGVWVLNKQTRSKDRPSLKYSQGGSGTLWKFDLAFCLATSNGGMYIVVPKNGKIKEEKK